MANAHRNYSIGFNSGVYEEIDLSEWVASNPADVLAISFLHRTAARRS